MDSSSNIVSNEVQIPRFVYFCDIHVMEDPGKFLFVALFSLVHRLSFSSSFLQGHKMIYRCMSDFLIPAPSLETSLQTLLRATDHTWKAALQDQISHIFILYSVRQIYWNTCVCMWKASDLNDQQCLIQEALTHFYGLQSL